MCMYTERCTERHSYSSAVRHPSALSRALSASRRWRRGLGVGQRPRGAWRCAHHHEGATTWTRCGAAAAWGMALRSPSRGSHAVDSVWGSGRVGHGAALTITREPRRGLGVGQRPRGAWRCAHHHEGATRRMRVRAPVSGASASASSPSACWRDGGSSRHGSRPWWCHCTSPSS